MRIRIITVTAVGAFALEAAAMVDVMALGGTAMPRIAWAAALVVAGIGIGLVARVTGGAGRHRALHLVLMGGLIAATGSPMATVDRMTMRMPDASSGLEAAIVLCCLAAVVSSVVGAVHARGRGRRRLRVELLASAAAMLTMVGMVLV